MNSPQVHDTMPLIIQNDGNWDSLCAAITEIASIPGVTGVMALTCSGLGTVPDSFDEFLRDLSVPIFGGVFPALTAKSEYLEHGNIVLGVMSELDVYIVPSLSDSLFDYDEWLADTVPASAMQESKTMFVLVDGLAPRIGALIDSLFNTFGLQANFIGGGAGSLVAPNLPCLITRHGVIRDAAVLVISKLHSQVSIAHGWTPVANAFEVTSSENNVILMLDWEPALNVYRRVLVAQTGNAFNFADVAPAYPFGLARFNLEFVVRDPVAVRHDGGLVCVGDVPQGTLVHIMQGNTDSLLSAADQVRAMADSQPLPASQWAVDIAMDCISRAMFLGDKISNEIDSLQHTARPLIGAFTLGEIANSGQEYLEFHNKTVVIASLWEGERV